MLLTAFRTLGIPDINLAEITALSSTEFLRALAQLFNSQE